MFGAQSNMAGKNYDQFMYAAMLSKARIQQAWSGGQDGEVKEEQVVAAAPQQAFDPAMLAQLASGEMSMPMPQMSLAPSMPQSAPSASSSIASSNASAPKSKFAGFSKEVIENAQKFAASRGISAPTIPAAFRRAPPAPSAGSLPDVPAAPTEMQSSLPTVSILSTSAPSDSSMNNSGIQQAGQQVVTEPFKIGGNDGESEAKTKAAEAVKDIVSLKLAEAQKAAESTKSFHAAAPEPKAVEPRKSRRGWDSAGGDRGDQVPTQGDQADQGSADRRFSETTDSKSTSIQSLSQRELAALARGEPHSDAPALGELRAPGQPSGGRVDEGSGKSGQADAREKRQSEMASYRARSRDRRRRRSPSSSPERSGKKRLFTATPSYRLTGSTFTTAPQKQAAESTTAVASQAAPQLKKDDMPDWLKDMAEPQAVVQAVKLGKKYLHMPRIMIEVLTHNGGEALRACGEKAQCQIKIETMIEEPVGIVSVNGNVALGEALIKETLANKGLDMPPQDGLVLPYATPAQTQRNELHQDITIPDSLVRHFVGHKGCNMKALHAELDRRHGGARTVSIQILPAVLPGGLRRIQITGSNRAEAKTLVQQHIDQLKSQHLTLTPSNDPNMHAGPQQYYNPQNRASGVRI